MVWLVAAAMGSLAGYVAYAALPNSFLPWSRFAPLVAGLLIAYVVALRGAYGTWRFPFLGFRERPQSPPGRGAMPLLLIWAGAVAFRVVLVGSVPALSDDVYRYIWDGRVLLSGINPYRYPPTAPELAPLRDALWPFINHHDLPTIYPPLCMLVFAAAAWIAPTVLAWKSVAAGMDLLAGYGFMRALEAWGRPRAWVVLYLWHPLVLFEFAGNGHADAIGMLLLALAFWGWAARKPMASGLALGLAGLVKFLPWIALPSLLSRLGRSALVIPLVIGAFYLGFWGRGLDPLGSLGVFAAKWRGNDFLFSVFVPQDAGDTQLHQGKILAGVLVVLVWLTTRFLRRSWISTYGWTVGALLLVSPVVHPWYVIWLLPVLFVLPHPAWWIWSLTVFMAYLPLAAYRATGVWEESLAWKAWEVSPVLTLLPLQAWLEGRNAGRDR
jgi:hypothetical protein